MYPSSVYIIDGKPSRILRTYQGPHRQSIFLFGNLFLKCDGTLRKVDLLRRGVPYGFYKKVTKKKRVS